MGQNGAAAPGTQAKNLVPAPGMLPEISTRRRSSAVRPSASSQMALAALKASLSGRLCLAPSMTWILLCGFSSISLQEAERVSGH